MLRDFLSISYRHLLHRVPSLILFHSYRISSCRNSLVTAYAKLLLFSSRNTLCELLRYYNRWIKKNSHIGFVISTRISAKKREGKEKWERIEEMERKRRKRRNRERGTGLSVSGAGQPLEAGRGFCTGVLRRLLPKAVWCHGERGKTRKEEKKPKERGEVRRNTKEPEGARTPYSSFSSSTSSSISFSITYSFSFPSSPPGFPRRKQP